MFSTFVSGSDMPSDKRGGRGRSAIYNYRVKAGNKEVFSHPQKGKCAEYIRQHNGKGENGEKLRLIPPNI